MKSFASVVTVARLAQSVEHETLNLRVVGSSPTLGDQDSFVFFLNFPVLTGKCKNYFAQRGARTHDPEIKSLMLYQLS